MLLSFSHPTMLPMIRAGIRQAQGEDTGEARVKRQTIRRRGPRAERLLEWAREAHWTHPYDLHLWWKSRTAEREHLGTIASGGYCYPVTILHDMVEPTNAPAYPVIRMDGPNEWRSGDSMIFWAADERGGAALADEAYADGFDSVEGFRDFFVPKVGDHFAGILFKW